MDTMPAYVPKRFATYREYLDYKKIVNARYSKTEKGRVTSARSNAGPLAKARYERYRQTEKYQAAQVRRAAKDKSNGWPQQKARKAYLKANEPEKLSARYAISSALRAGLITKPTECASCGSTRAIHAHHHLGYAPEHWLTVEWLCAKCHRARHV